MQVAGHKQRPPLHPQEKWFLGLAMLQLVFLPWAFGTMHVWSQLTALGLGAVLLGVALWPRFYSTDLCEGPEFQLRSWPRLMRFPLFWLGLGLLFYLGLQAWNPAWLWTRNATSWWLVRVNEVEWLPTSIQTPFERFNLWRQFIIYAITWLTACACWIGVTRRRTMHVLLGALVANACVLGLVGFVHKASGEPRLLWMRDFPGASSFASFVYQNHAGAYFSLMSFTALGLAVWHFFEGRKRMARSTPAALWLIAALLLVFAVVFSLSRGAIISLALFAIAAMIALLLLRFTTATQSTIPTIVPVLVALGVIGTVAWMVRQIDFSAVYFRFEQLSRLQANDPSVLSRQLARESATQMLGDHWVRGVGAGGFRYLFPGYIKDKPLIYERGQLFWEHAHNDWLEIPIELGLTGVLLLVAGAGWLAWTWFRGGGWRHPLVLMIGLGVCQVMAHAVMDFPFQNPAILVTWLVLLIVSLRWLELDGGNPSRPSH
ncbi:MAG: O-antigen ligase family protein [Opitutae bacterium]|nr:O-antigen ligase family protein [Opitutae bacterium]